MLPEKSQAEAMQATVVLAVGLGSKRKGGEIRPVCVKVGDKVLRCLPILEELYLQLYKTSSKQQGLLDAL